MRALPKALYTGRINSSTQDTFGGLNRRSSAADGEICDMYNMCSDNAPLLSPRRPRTLVSTSKNNNGIFSLDGLLEVIGTHVYYNSVEVGTVTNTKKTISALGSKIIILPDKVYYDTKTSEFKDIEASVKNVNAKIQDGEYAGEPAKANTIYSKDAAWANFFKVGDAVTISGAFIHPQNNITIIIREIDGDHLRFYDNSFVIGSSGDDEKITISRSMPDMDFICENDNRLFGCKGDTVYASKLGDVTNWNVFEGVSGSWAVDVGSSGDFTGCITFLGYPIFFKEDVIYKLYGNEPSNFQLIRSASLGVAPGNSQSLAIAGEVLFYMSRVGIVAYSGSTPYNVFLPFDNERFGDCVAGSDGKKYYVSMKKENGAHELAVYDTEFSVWHIEDDTAAVAFSYYNGLYMMTDDKLWLLDGKGDEKVTSYIEFADNTMSAPNKKSVTKISIRCTVSDNSMLTIKIMYDSSGTWQTVRTLPGANKKSYYLPVIPHRCDHFKLRLEGVGDWMLHSLSREYSYGSLN
jgi:hypothetical protein